MVTRRKSTRKNSGPQLRLYSRSVVRGLCGITESELALWESEELVGPARLLEREPLYDEAALRRIRLIRTLADDLEINVPGISVILRLLEQLGR